jgi:predicted nuclease of predicted toxin-antitoxin system
MSQRIKFHLDENVSNAIALGLRRRGIDVTTTKEVGLMGASDEEQIEFALTQGRVIFTQDDDFLRMHQAGTTHAGITYCRQRSRSIGEIINTLTLIWEWIESEEIKNKVEFI